VATTMIRLLAPGGTDQLEQWVEASATGPDFVVAHPATWSWRPVPPMAAGKSAIDIYLAHDNRLMGYVRVKSSAPGVATPAPAQAALAQATAELREAGVTALTAWVPETDPAILATADLQTAFVAEGKLGDANVELRIGLLDRGAQFAVTLIAVRRAHDVMTWMRSKRAFEIALITVRPA
jgi:hypothetical protein